MHFEHTFLPLYILMSSMLSQKMQEGWYFFRTILSSSTKISTGSLQLMFRILRSSIGRTIRPSESTGRTIPVDFIFFNFLSVVGTFLIITKITNFVN